MSDPRAFKKQRRGPKALSNGAAIKRAVDRMSETKAFYTRVTSTDVDNTGARFAVGEIPQGVSNTNRVGDSVHIREIVVNIDFSEAASQNPFCRATLIRQTANSQLDITDIYESADFEFSQFDYNNRKKFQVLWDKRFNMQSQIDVSHQITETIHGSWSVLFSTGSQTVSKGNIYLYLSSSASNANAQQASFTTRILYKDG